MVTIAEGIAAATFALNAARDLRSIDRSISEADFKLKIATLTESVADVKIAMVDLQDELRERERTIAELRAALKAREETVKVGGFHFMSDQGQPVGMPFCSVCIESGSFQRTTYGAGFTYCPKCKANFGRVSGKANPNNL
jgi:hypothetical protein